ncbi:MAG: hypothetical protein UY22_C0006G0002 [Candidatus Amesbacteria bacterium GW2011_GWC1_48_10]|uniref:Uncharacterized protein n=1 Tax=Candidatus Amesbacteria bacterium GW2011_GWC1_48_10 TaxID=1618365 RepID=A0A0G1UKZ4_9BACT|nr:MAG: hypothetical protein UY22_C0006G0002 [Candidatus Amesbacteria bacterium GW2011_GWC1_48_10]
MFNKKNTQFIHRLVSVVALCGILLVQVLPVRAQSAPPPPPPPPPPPAAPPTTACAYRSASVISADSRTSGSDKFAPR